jgi:ribosome-associated toxin RatA of RatAB toxin-antitoxin module
MSAGYRALLGLPIVAITCSFVFTAPRVEARAEADAADVTVREQDGIYHVAATFSVAQSAPVVFAVLTGYEEIPRYMPDVRSSRVIERSDGRAVVEQEAVARVMMFSKRVHLLLDVREEPRVIRFRDRCGRSFDHYEGAWTLTAAAGAGRVDVRYELAAKPSFDVPEFLIKRLLKRDAQEMIRRLRGEMARVAPAGR